MTTPEKKPQEQTTKAPATTATPAPVVKADVKQAKEKELPLVDVEELASTDLYNLDDLVKFDDATAEELKFASQSLEEYCVAFRAPCNYDKFEEQFIKLHVFFAILATYGGEEHKYLFKMLMRAYVQYPHALSPTVRYRKIELMDTSAQRKAFTSYLNLVEKFVRCENKANFKSTSNVSRTADMFVQENVANAVSASFGV